MSGSLPDTSDIGMMYRQLLQSKGVPVTPDNIRRAVVESRRNPNLISGLDVQQEGPTTPPNVEAAAGAQRAVPQALPTPPIPPAPQPRGDPTTGAGNMAPSGPPVNPAASAQAQPPSQAQAQPQAPPTGEPGGPPTPGQIATDPSSIAQVVLGALPAVAAWAQGMLRNKPPAPSAGSGAPIGTQGPVGDPATAPIGNILTESAAPPPSMAPPAPAPQSAPPRSSSSTVQNTRSPEQMREVEAAMMRNGMGSAVRGAGEASRAARLRGVRLP